MQGILELKNQKENIYFLDADDKITKNVNILYKEIKYSKFDYVFCDTQWIENSINQRKISLVIV